MGREQRHHGKNSGGRYIGPLNPDLYSAGITRGYSDFAQAEAKHTSHNQQVHEVVVLAFGAPWHSPYDLYAHSAVARKAGLSQAAIRDTVEGRIAEDLLPEERVAYRLAYQLASEKRVEQATYAEGETSLDRLDLSILPT